MEMFDYVVCKFPLANLVGKLDNNILYRTKRFNCGFDLYVITESGWLYQIVNLSNPYDENKGFDLINLNKDVVKLFKFTGDLWLSQNPNFYLRFERGQLVEFCNI